MALADALREQGARVSFIGTGRGLERELVPEAGYELDLADLRGLERRFSPRIFLFLWSLLKGSADCLRILRRRRPQAVAGGGGYVSAVPLFWAALRRTPTLIVELDSHMGLANRSLTPLVNRVALAFPIEGLEGDKYLQTGRPMGQQLLGATAERGRELFGLREDLKTVLVTGGSLGARSLNMACVEAFSRGGMPFQVLHVSGRRDYEMVRRRLKQEDGDHGNYHLLDYTNDLPQAVAAADLVVSRSGASVLEIAALGKPSILVPYPHATGDHQRKNAEWMAAAGAAELIDDSRLDARLLADRVSELLADDERLRRMAESSGGLARRDGAARIAGEIYAIAGR